LKSSQNNRNNIFVLKCDIRKFFDSIDHDVLRGMLQSKISDSGTLELLDKIIKSYSTRPGKGIPLGNVTSQLLANIYLNKLDQFVRHQIKAKYYLRYCDDFIILGHNREDLLAFILKINEFLKIVLHLELHPNKISIRTYRQGIDFLGWVSFPHHRVLRTSTKKRMFRNIKNSRADINTLQSYFGLISHGNTRKLGRKIMDLLNNT